MNLRGIARRIERLTQQSGPAEDRPMVFCYLPDNGRGPGGPQSDVQVVQATPTTQVIIYPPGSPPLELTAWQARETVRP